MSAGQTPLRPRVAVVGLWHLGSVIAACVSDDAWPVLGIDPDLAVLDGLRAGRAPLFEPGLDNLLGDHIARGWLDFGDPRDERLAAAKIVWVTFDTPVDDQDRADVEWVMSTTAAVLERAALDALVVVSSQLPVGSIATLGRRMAEAGRDDLRFACVPENLRLGRGIKTFSSPDRFVAGVWSQRDREQLQALLGRFTNRIEWMGVESAEMTKHALNAFLATSVAFINEIAVICERVGADASDVARGLKSEERIGARAYLSPGDAFAGGTLARDVAFLTALAEHEQLPAAVADGVAESNESHRGWARRALQMRLSPDGDTDGLIGRRMALWGLTYKPGTSTLRRSSAVELARWLKDAGASVVAYDPVIDHLPAELDLDLSLAAGASAAADGADALVICTPWPEFRDVPGPDVVAAMRGRLVLDAAGHLQATLGAEPALTYARVGTVAP